MRRSLDHWILRTALVVVAINLVLGCWLFAQAATEDLRSYALKTSVDRALPIGSGPEAAALLLQRKRFDVLQYPAMQPQTLVREGQEPIKIAAGEQLVAAELTLTQGQPCRARLGALLIYDTERKLRNRHWLRWTVCD